MALQRGGAPFTERTRMWQGAVRSLCQPGAATGFGPHHNMRAVKLAWDPMTLPHPHPVSGMSYSGAFHWLPLRRHPVCDDPAHPHVQRVKAGVPFPMSMGRRAVQDPWGPQKPSGFFSFLYHLFSLQQFIYHVTQWSRCTIK